MEKFYVPLSEIKANPMADGGASIMIWEAYPLLKYFYTSYEMTYDKVPQLQEFIARKPLIPIYTCILYAIMIIGGKYIMSKREAFDLKSALAYWNLFLAAFSFMGMIRTVPYVVFWLSELSFKGINCLIPSSTHGDRDIGLWVMLFAASKFFELIDTLFIILRKKPLIFLHWYHHVTVLLFTYYACAYRHAGLIFTAINYSVHTVMYGYFYMVALGVLPKWFNPVWITVAQISQMFVGVYVTASAAYYKYIDGGCVGAKDALLLGGMAMYGSYFYLFVEFAVKRFIIGPKGKRTKQLKGQLGTEKSGGKSNGNRDAPPSPFKTEDSYGIHEKKSVHPGANGTVRSGDDHIPVEELVDGKEKAQ